MHDEEENMSTLENPSEVYYRAYKDYWRKVNESDGFDLENISTPPYYMFKGLLPFDCVSCGYPYPVMVDLYAKVGLHRYNMLKVTLITKNPLIPHFHSAAVADGFFKGELPDWPSDDALNDEKRFYLVRLFESEWQANDWISMYLELVICAHDRRIKKAMAIETGIEEVEPPNERLEAKSANVYIKFKGMANVRYFRMIFEIGEHVERKAVVRRVLDEHSGYMTLLGKFCGGQNPKKQ
ncbi:unnamed protein product, partial [Brassica oleracea]